MGQKHSTYGTSAVESQKYSTRRNPMGVMRQPIHWTNNQNTYYENYNGVSVPDPSAAVVNSNGPAGDPTLERAQSATRYLGLSDSSLRKITRPAPRATPEMTVRSKNLDPRYANGLSNDSVASGVAWNMSNKGIDTSRTNLQLVDAVNADRQKMMDVRDAKLQLQQTYMQGSSY